MTLTSPDRVLLCASLFPFRLPREEWVSRLAQVRDSGYDAVDVYVPWNFHETAPGEWDFTGRRDVGAFLDLAHDAGLLVVARPGPYICSEWDGGGLPAWLPLTPGLRLRDAEPQYLAAVRGWFDRVLPLLAERQHDRGGPVVAVQLENELDFSDCADRPGYLTALRDMAEAHGITVPLIACAGQGDLHGATGDVERVVPACNFYPDDASPDVEAEVRAYARRLADRGLPLLVTETNRAHVTLRRILVSGATVIAPYLQGSGYDLGWTPSVGNWGDPGGFMSHDYDFGGYLSPVGEARPELADARVLSAVVRTLGPALARAEPAEDLDGYRTGAPTSASPSVLRLAGGGTLLGMPNLGDLEAVATLPATGSTPAALVRLPPRSCTYVLRDLPLDRYGLPGTLLLTTADLVGAGPDGLELAAAGPSMLALGDPTAPGAAGVVALVELAAPLPGEPVRETVRLGARAWPVVVRHPRDVRGPDGTPPRLGAVLAAEPQRLEVATRLDLPTRTGRGARHALPPASEQVGVHRGRTHYAADVGAATEVVLQGAADVVDLALDGRALPTVARFGATEVVPVAAVDRLEATVETWGHANFDDHRLPALRVGSLRGLGRVWSVVARTDVGALWAVDGGAQWAGDPAPLRRLGGWSSTRLGRPVTYRRALPVDDAHDHLLHLPGLAVPALVLRGGVEHAVTPEDPWLHLPAGTGTDVAITVPHVPGVLDGATLLRVLPVRDWDVEPQPDRAIAALARRPARGRRVALPVRPRAGEELWLEVALPPGGWSLRFEGAQVRLSVLVPGGRDAGAAAGELLGRVWLADPARPVFTGGDPGRVWVPAAWNPGSVRVLVRGTAGEVEPELAAVLATPVRG